MLSNVSCDIRTVLYEAEKLPEHALHSGSCYRKSVCLSSVTFLRPTQLAKIFRNVSMPFCTTVFVLICKFFVIFVVDVSVY